ncbi:hypothetical protein GC163_23920 [bacterium]|nr:hypothetical protein [bacterium]
MMLDDRKQNELAELRDRIERLEEELAAKTTPQQWPPKGFYWEYYATTGFLLGIFGAMASLMVNVIGAPIAGKSPLELIRVYLTFPLGEQALRIAAEQTDVYAIGDGVMLAIGCCLYLATGMVLGVPFYVILARFTDGKSLGYRLGVATVLSLVLWVINFYGVLSWLQPALIGGNWITDPAILPTWVAAVTHLVFGWTLALTYPLGRFQVYQQPTSTPSH